MPLHRTSLTSRRDLEHPEEKPVVPLAFERVLKFNPNHGADGRFASAGGGKKGGTAGPPTEDAMGRPLKGKGKASARLAGGLDPVGTVYTTSGEKFLPDEALPIGDTRNDPVGTLYTSDRKYLPKSHTGSMDKSGQPTKRSTFS